MRTIIRAVKEEMKRNETLHSRVKELTTDIKEVDNHYHLSPQPGRLFDILSLLRQNGVNYTTDFNVDDDMHH